MVVLETIKAKTYVDSKVCTRHGRNLYGNFEQFYRKGKIIDSEIEKIRKWENSSQ
jgi:hypothetical protein